MKNLAICIACAALLTAGCAATKEKGHNPLPDRFHQLLEQTTQALDYGYGYDQKLDLGLVYNYSFSKLNAAQKEKNFADIVMKADNRHYLSFCLHVYGIYAETLYKKDRFRADKNWKYYTYLKKYLLPPLKAYLDLLEKYLLIKDPAAAGKLSSYHKSIKDDIERYYRELAEWEAIQEENSN